ncbi:Uncharacterized protein dnm_071310 [Desulfonema magnum]|uniref:Cytochrome C n=1 Tax=Desulfonema magnum TaxID=45655 RepID=A0A975BSX7_9BACT|nr:Uncharacterized protein dnm_071310 [Desulfonema magnum]
MSAYMSAAVIGKERGGIRDSLPPVYRQCAVCHTDFRSA